MKFPIKVSEKKLSGFSVVTLEVSIPDLPAEFQDYHLVQLTDFHLGPATPPTHVKKAIDVTATLKPDLLLLTGDYVHNDPIGHNHWLATNFSPKLFDWISYRRNVRHLCHVLAELIGELDVPDGVFATLGNHDYLEGVSTVTRQLGAVATWLVNERAHVHRGNYHIEVVGVDDLKRGKVDLERALAGKIRAARPKQSETSVPPTTPGEQQPSTQRSATPLPREHSTSTNPAFRILLSHNPDVTLHEHEPLINEFGLMLCGHTHGGQIRLPLLGPIATRTKQKWHTRGLSAHRKVPVYVSSGVGYGLIQFRLLCPPEITCIRLKKA